MLATPNGAPEAPEAYAPEKHTTHDFKNALKTRIEKEIYPFAVQTDERIWVVESANTWQRIKPQIGVAIAKAVAHHKRLVVRNIGRGTVHEITPMNPY